MLTEDTVCLQFLTFFRPCMLKLLLSGTTFAAAGGVQTKSVKPSSVPILNSASCFMGPSLLA